VHFNAPFYTVHNASNLSVWTSLLQRNQSKFNCGP